MASLCVVWLAHFGQTMVGGYVAACLTKKAIPVYFAAGLTMIRTVVNQVNLLAPLCCCCWTWLEVPLHLVVEKFILQCTVTQQNHTKNG